MKPIIFLFTLIFTGIMTFFVIILSYKKNILDYPKENSLHQKPLPMLGGLVIFFVFFITSLIFRAFDNLLPLFLGSLIMIASGIYDDLAGINAPRKLLIQFTASLVIIFFGMSIARIKIPFGPTLELGVFSIPATVIWFILMINLINIIDGLDGLACGLAFVIFFTLAHFSWPEPIGAQLVILLASTLAFLFFNFQPAKIFLGNNGSSFLGFIIAYFSLVTSQKSTIFPVLILPCILLVVHLIDAAYAVIRRKSLGVSIFKGDKRHVHHIMLNRIGSHRVTVLLFYLISIIIAFAVLSLPSI